MMKNTKGITLIALIITIIVMIILVSVSISIAINTGLFKSASEATKKWNAAQAEESQMQIEIGGKKYDSIEDYLAGVESIPKIHNWQYVDENTRDEIRCTCDICKAFDDGDSTGRTLKIGQQIGETENTTASTSITSAKSGSDSNQTLDLNAEETKWVVFGFEDKNGDTKNETLLLTTEKPTANTIDFKGAAAYNNAIDEINRMCKELYGSNARGITIKDVNRTLGYEPEGGMYYLNSKYNTTGNLTTKLKDLGDMWTAILNNNTNGVFYDPSHPDGISDNGAALGEYELNGYFYVASSRMNPIEGVPVISSTIADSTKAMVFGSTSNYHYWLTSRGTEAISNNAGFGAGTVSGGTAKSNGYWTGKDAGLLQTAYSLRPLVSLTSDIPAAGDVLFSSFSENTSSAEDR